MRKSWIFCLIACLVLCSFIGARALEPDETINIEVTLPTETDIDQVISIDIPPEDEAEDMPTDGDDMTEDDISSETGESEEPAEEEVTVRVVPTFTEAPLEEVRPCAYGDSGENVRLLQERLRMLGFTLETPDGLFGKRTREHVIELQRYLKGKSGTSFQPNGEVSKALCDELNSLGFPRYERDVSMGSEGRTVLRVQRRLCVLGYLGRSKVDSVFGESTQEALSQFQKVAGLNATGIADKETQNLLFGSVAPSALSAHCEYSLYVDLDKQVLSAFAWNNATQTYDKLAREMPCSTGQDGYETPTGTFIVEDHRAQSTYFRMYHAYARYVTVFNTKYYIHSVLYAREDSAQPVEGANGSLTQRVSKGSIRVSAEDAEWIYKNCRIGTTIEIG